MACDRIEGVLQIILHTQETARSTEDFAPYCWRIPPYHQDAYGKVEGVSLLFTTDAVIDICCRPMTGDLSLVCRFRSLSTPSRIHSLRPRTETMTEHRAKTLFGLLQIALATGYSEVEPDLEPLKVFSHNTNHEVNTDWTLRTLIPI
jgi:hypothetical protein